ncbi:MAG: hypothetical protein K9N47_07410 [Prosthecobacter sp.]|uniref:lipopolysaccharide biosynthesis protein n=1 Tax=Prosthecobacter sp. TaxID=1965333 RepID=UPI0025DE412A|nr:hypothetical protein [Prosthecobacter sp.]MCF7785933.1 hypothetical protein [Prosthecobacter sp.]
MFLWLSLRHNRLRLYRWSATFGGFALVQLLVQALNAVAGFLLVRTLEKPDYAWFTIASSMSAALAVLADAGIVSAVTSIGGTIWQDKASLKGLVQAALRLRMKLAVLCSVIVAVISIWLLLRNGAGLPSALGLTALVLAPIWQISTTVIFNVVNRLQSRTRQLQVADLVPVLVRTSLTMALAMLGGLTPLTALVAVLVAHLSQFVIVRGQVLPLLADVQPSGVADHTASIWKVIHQLLPNCIFICIQGQLATWLISVFATTSEVSDLGALNRLAVIFAVLAGPLGQFVFPSFARAADKKRMWAMAITLVAGTVAFSIVLLAFASWQGHWFLWILGGKYAHLQRELVVVLAGMALTNVSGFVWALNAARGWNHLAWLNIPLTLTTQAVAAFLLPLNSVMGLAWFIIASAVVQCGHALTTCIFGLTHDPRIQSAAPIC